MAKIFDGFNSSASWLDEFINSQAADDNKKETLAQWEDDVIVAVKTHHYSGLDEALIDLKSRLGITEAAADSLKSGILKKVATDVEWHKIHGTTSNELVKLAAVKADLVKLANSFDEEGTQEVSDAIDQTLRKLP